MRASATVRLPRVMRDYACQRTLVCCRPPWRVWLSDAEVESVWWHAHEAGMPASETNRFDDWLDDAGPGRQLVSQRRGACAMLDENTPACVLQVVGGAEAQPLQCRSFPRSVVRLRGEADGRSQIEAAFLIDCPTAAAIVVDRPESFVWTEVDLGDWRYAPSMSVGTGIRWRADQSATLEALDALRRGWWDALGGALDATDATTAVLELLGGLRRAPDDPSVAVAPVVTPLEPGLRIGLLGALSRLPARGEYYQSSNPDLARLLAEVPTSADALATSMPPTPAAPIVCAASLLAQHAGLHDPRPALTTLAGVADQLVLTLQVRAALARLEGTAPREAMLDALTATSHVVRFRQLGAGVLMD